MQEVDKYAKIIWDYMLMHQELEKADVIFIPGSNDVRVAERAAELYKEGYAPYVLCSGGFGKDTHFKKTEGETFADVVLHVGVPQENILLENMSTNTGENVLFSRELLQKKNIQVKSIIAVNKPYMERRMFAAISRQWPDVRCMVTSSHISYEAYTSDPWFKEEFINLMVGDLQRIKEYPAQGLQIPQEIPDNVWQAYEKLVEMGYTKYLIKVI